MSDTTTDSTNVKSIRHQKILDVAADNPDASIADLAAEIPSATADLVERVLDKYGDPAESTDDAGTDSPEQLGQGTDTTESTATDGNGDAEPAADSGASAPSDEQDTRPDVDDLSRRELETLHAIREQPDATQREIAELLDVSGATVSNRVNSIPGFDWSTREAFANDLFEDADDDLSIEFTTAASATAMTDGATAAGDESSSADTDTSTEVNGDEAATVSASIERTTVEQLSDRLTTIEEQLEAIERDTETESAFTDPELTHKVVHACLEADTISEEEELQILRDLLN